MQGLVLNFFDKNAIGGLPLQWLIYTNISWAKIILSIKTIG
jgi:hypothetical protein